MKRCPQCQFIYLNSDEWCDFDQTPLASIDDETVEAAINTNSSNRSSSDPAPHANFNPHSKQLIPILAAVLLLMIGLGLGGLYLVIKMRSNQRGVVTEARPVPVPTAQPQTPPTFPASIVQSTPEPTPKVSPTPTPTRSPSRAAVSNGPVSTTGVRNNAKNGKPVILLTSGGRIEADQVWRAKEGIWYRRDGVVTLLKKERVRTIVGQ